MTNINSLSYYDSEGNKIEPEIWWISLGKSGNLNNKSVLINTILFLPFKTGISVPSPTSDYGFVQCLKKINFPTISYFTTLYPSWGYVQYIPSGTTSGRNFPIIGLSTGTNSFDINVWYQDENNHDQKTVVTATSGTFYSYTRLL